MDRFATAERPNYELMLDIITYLREFTDRVHHPREDIANAGRRCATTSRRCSPAPSSPRETVEAAAAVYLVYYGDHIAKEEDEILPRASATLTREDWAAVRAAVPDPRLPIVAPRI